MQEFPVDGHMGVTEEPAARYGIGPTSARRIVVAAQKRAAGACGAWAHGRGPQRAQYFIRTSDWPPSARPDKEMTVRALIDPKVYSLGRSTYLIFGDTAGLRPLPAARDMKSISEAVEGDGIMSGVRPLAAASRYHLYYDGSFAVFYAVCLKAFTPANFRLISCARRMLQPDADGRVFYRD
jgi:hypothetical protein